MTIKQIVELMRSNVGVVSSQRTKILKTSKLLQEDTFKLLLMYSGYERYYTWEEIAKELKIKVETAKSRLQTIKERHPEIMEKLKKDHDFNKKMYNHPIQHKQEVLSYDDPTMANKVTEKY